MSACRFASIRGRQGRSSCWIAFGVAPDGSYFGARANALEDNLLFFRVVKGQRHVSDTIRNVATASRQWHTLAVELRGPEVKVVVDGAQKFQKTLDKRPEGRLGCGPRRTHKFCSTISQSRLSDNTQRVPAGARGDSPTCSTNGQRLRCDGRVSGPMPRTSRRCPGPGLLEDVFSPLFLFVRTHVDERRMLPPRILPS